MIFFLAINILYLLFSYLLLYCIIYIRTCLSNNICHSLQFFSVCFSSNSRSYDCDHGCSAWASSYTHGMPTLLRWDRDFNQTYAWAYRMYFRDSNSAIRGLLGLLSDSMLRGFLHGRPSHVSKLQSFSRTISTLGPLTNTNILYCVSLALRLISMASFKINVLSNKDTTFFTL